VPILGREFPSHALFKHHSVRARHHGLKFKCSPAGVHGIPARNAEKIIID